MSRLLVDIVKAECMRQRGSRSYCDNHSSVASVKASDWHFEHHYTDFKVVLLPTRPTIDVSDDINSYALIFM